MRVLLMDTAPDFYKGDVHEAPANGRPPQFQDVLCPIALNNNIELG